MGVFPSTTGSAPNAGPSAKSKKYVPPVLAYAVIALCLIVTGSIGLIVVYPQIKAAYHWRRAQEAIDRFDLAKAKEHLSKCSEVWTSSGETEFLMARTCRRAGDVDSARQHLKKAKHLNWVAEQIQLEYLLIQAQTALLPSVEERLKGLLTEGHQDDRLILEALVVGSFQGHFLQKAYQWSTVWVEQHPDDWEARFYYASALEGGLRHDIPDANEMAAIEFQKALELNPYFPDIHLHLAQVFLLNNRSRDALPHFQEYLNHHPNDPLALLGLARCWRSAGEPEEARATLERLFAAHPEDVGGYLLEAQLDLEEDNYKGAQEWLGNALRLDPDDRLSNQNMATALRQEAVALRSENRHQEADEKEKEAKEFEDRSQRIRQAYRRVEDINRKLLQKPDDVGLRTEAATLLMSVGQKQDALRWLTSALLINPQYKPANDALKEFLRRFGESTTLRALSTHP